MKDNRLIIVRGGGDIATGTIHRLHSCGYKLLILESDRPAAIRRQVSLCEAVYDGEATVEGARAVLVHNTDEAECVWSSEDIPMVVDPTGKYIEMLHPTVVVDAILAKKNLGTHIDMAPLTIALGPGFTAGRDADVVIETMRGHNLGRIIREGSALANTGVPGLIAGHADDRVIHAEVAGVMRDVHSIGDKVKCGEPIAYIEDGDKKTEVPATIDGIIRGLIRDGYKVPQGFKIADIDPRISEYDNCFTISDKARCIAGSVLEAIVASGIMD